MRRDEAIRDRGGRGSSVGGDPAKEALGALVRQFSQRSAFVRELVQNSLDAGSGRIELSSLGDWKVAVRFMLPPDYPDGGAAPRLQIECTNATR